MNFITFGQPRSYCSNNCYTVDVTFITIINGEGSQKKKEKMF